MGTLTDYFNRIAYKPKYEGGERVFGHYNKIPFIGTVGQDRMVNGITPELVIHLDLPIVIDSKATTVIIVQHKDIKSRLISMDETEPLKLPKAGSIPAKRTKSKGK